MSINQNVKVSAEDDLRTKVVFLKNQIDLLEKNLKEEDKIRRVLIAAGIVSESAFDDARRLVQSAG